MMDVVSGDQSASRVPLQGFFVTMDARCSLAAVKEWLKLLERLASDWLRVSWGIHIFSAHVEVSFIEVTEFLVGP